MDFLALTTLEHVGYAIQLALGFVFSVAASSKLRHPRRFRDTVAEYALVPMRFASVVAVGVVALESFVGVVLLLGWFGLLAPILAGVTLGVFAAAVGINLWRGREIHCGCFGDGTEEISVRGLVRVLLLMGWAIFLTILIATTRLPITLGTVTQNGTSGLAYLVEIGGIAAFVILMDLWLLHVSELKYLIERIAMPGSVGVTTARVAEVDQT